MLEVLVLAACLETSEGCSKLSDHYFKYKGYDQIYDAFTKKYRRELEFASPGIFMANVATQKSLKFKYRPFTFEVKQNEFKTVFTYDW